MANFGVPNPLGKNIFTLSLPVVEEGLNLLLIT
jgi:hypothetical protein